MNTFRFVVFASVTLVLCMLFSYKMGPLPPLGNFISPFTGFWQNAEAADDGLVFPAGLESLKDEVAVLLDEQRVPHVFAKNEYDLYFMQGYCTARDRLWQMEFMIMAASGRVSEVIGSRALEFDRTQRRIGIPYAAKNAIAQLYKDSLSRAVLSAYSAGVNAYINSLEYKDLPLEYKLLDYQPELWSPFNSALLLKYMANMLTGKDYDIEYSNALKFLDKQTFDVLFPDFPPGLDPVIPAGTPFHKTTSSVNDTANTSASLSSMLMDPFIPSAFENVEWSKGAGSNNWAVSGNKSTTGYPMLCNDPHLRLQVPSIWYMQQLNAPGINAFGVTIPGAPGITLGFNDHIAWGVTNGSMDVRDWYRIEFKDSTKNEYLFDGKWLNTKKVVEEIKIRDQQSYFDTMIYTHHGPVTYDGTYGDNDSAMLALRWTAHDPSNEMKTFYLLNRAKNYDEYIAALDHYECPGQNFVFASVSGDIAIKEQGKFILRNKGEGKFIQDGTTSESEWDGFIPFEDNPHVKNPPRGFVSSANQHPTDTTYPYYYIGIYEYYRNRRINNVLSSKEKFSPEDLRLLQNDNYNMMASEALPYLLTMIDAGNMSDAEKKAFHELTFWNFYNDRGLTAPTYFTVMWDKFYSLLWDEFIPENKKGLTAPDEYNTISFIINSPEHDLVDNKETPERETLTSLVQQAFSAAAKELKAWADSAGMEPEWTTYKATALAHFLRIDALAIKKLPIGGDLHIVNATSSTHGQSWKMIVALGDSVNAWGIYPGGQSGNPGSPFYSDLTDKWANGEYNPLLLLQSADDADKRIVSRTTIKPAE